MIESNALVQSHFEQFFHRQLAARVGETDHDSIDLSIADDQRDVSDRADDARVDHRRADLLGIGIDKPDQLDAEFTTAMQDAVNSVLNGQATPADALAKAQTSAQKALDDAWAKLDKTEQEG